jgi:hypothetical protein
VIEGKTIGASRRDTPANPSSLVNHHRSHTGRLCCLRRGKTGNAAANDDQISYSGRLCHVLITFAVLMASGGQPGCSRIWAFRHHFTSEFFNKVML